MNTDLKALYNEFAGYMERGDEQAARKLLVENIPNFPKELQDEILFGLFEEGVVRAASEGDMIAKMQQRGMQNLEALHRVQNKIKDQLRIIEVERTIDRHQ